MKKLFKSISVLVLSLSLVLSGIVFVGNTKADATTDSWKANAVKTPSEGSLVGAGYVDVEFDNSMPDYTYEVLLDGNPVYWIGNNIVKTDIGETVTGEAKTKSFTSSDEGKTEVYSTDVKKHEITVKATKGSETILSNPRVFYVSKKGLAMGDNMGDKVSLKKLNCSWYYNWGTKAFNNSIDNGVSHAPMMWGGYDDSKEDIKQLKTNSNYILGFNEPDIESQANMNFWDAVDVWKDYISPLKMRKVSPGPAAPGGNSIWLQRFINGDYICHNTYLNDGSWGLYYDYKDDASKKFVDGVSDDVDSVALHYYMDRIDADGLIAAVNTLWETYHKPIWITEIGLFGKKGAKTDKSYELSEKRAEVQAYLSDVVSRLNSISYVERFCWFPYDIDSKNDIDEFDGSGATAMFEYASGKYTELGKMYSSTGNPEGYSAETISDSEMFVYEERITKEAPTETTTEQPTTQITTQAETTTTQPQVVTQEPTTKKTVKKPVKATLSKAQNVKKKSVKLSWKSVANADKYKVQWALNKKFTKSKKTKIVTKTNYKVTKLKKKKTYYFRIAAMNSAGIGPWSNVKKTKIKK